ncbi:hypothetical protein MC885_004233 [Smutsia gigantea]|nr:hypothetical protein MC885_004233 [Smutsia gigantea]
MLGKRPGRLLPTWAGLPPTLDDLGGSRARQGGRGGRGWWRSGAAAGRRCVPAPCLAAGPRAVPPRALRPPGVETGRGAQDAGLRRRVPGFKPSTSPPSSQPYSCQVKGLKMAHHNLKNYEPCDMWHRGSHAPPGSGQVFIIGCSAAAGATGRLLFGYDSFGNVCGKKNSPVEGAPLSGQDMTLKKHVFFMNSCNLDVKDVRLSSTILCVSSCPEEQLDTLEEVQLFANNNGSFLCVYSLNSVNYTQNPNADSLCPRLPVPPRCSRHSEREETPQPRLLGGSHPDSPAASPLILGACWGSYILLYFSALSSAIMFTFRFITVLLSHIFMALVVLGLLFVCGVLWWLYYDYTNDLSTELDTERENMECLLGFAIVSTVITAALLLLIFVLRKRIELAVELVRVTNKAIRSSPFLLLQPLWTSAFLVFFWVLWVAVLLSLGTAGAAQVIEGGQVEYKALSGIRYMWWYHLIGLVWTSEFILACQQMTIAGAVVTCYFNR